MPVGTNLAEHPIKHRSMNGHQFAHDNTASQGTRVPNRLAGNFCERKNYSPSVGSPTVREGSSLSRDGVAPFLTVGLLTHLLRSNGALLLGDGVYALPYGRASDTVTVGLLTPSQPETKVKSEEKTHLAAYEQYFLST